MKMSDDRDYIGETTDQAAGGKDDAFGSNAIVSGGDTGIDAGTGAAGESESAIATLKDQAVDTGQKILAQTKETAGQAIDRAKEQVKSQITDRKDKAAGSLSGAVRALEATGQQFRNEDLAFVANYADSLTGQVRHASDYLRDRNVDDITRDVEDWARKNPSLFIGGAFVLGIALARFLKSSGSPSPLAAFTAGRDALVPVTPVIKSLTPPPSDSPQDAFGERRPLTAHNYVPGIGVTSPRGGA